MKVIPSTQSAPLNIRRTKKWSRDEQILLVQLVRRNLPLPEIALSLNRTESSCESKLRRLKPISLLETIHRPHFTQRDELAAADLIYFHSQSALHFDQTSAPILEPVFPK